MSDNRVVNKINVLFIEGTEENKYNFWREVNKRLQVTDFCSYKSPRKLEDILSIIENEENGGNQFTTFHRNVKCIIFSGVKSSIIKEVGSELDNMVLSFSVDDENETKQYLEFIKKL